eukprot:TRINITY_DN63119_c0_g1_i1.p2 TRINITY_DN63119_c0_g1~~TRINITY_DN63119_c0_g1_i1.p2  ORF type:complete len:467 (-),score=50.00 TRINITY_DN63119_c0_g1_i1:2206-3585(-)
MDESKSVTRGRRRAGTVHSIHAASWLKQETLQRRKSGVSAASERTPLLPPKNQASQPSKSTPPRPLTPPAPRPGLKGQIVGLLKDNYLNILLVLLPFSFISFYGGWSPVFTFIFSFFCLVPLAAMLGTFTEDLALRSNESLAALLNATFGNATELIISLFALKDELYTVIKNSLIGSVLGNLLLVMGCAALAGGLREKIVNFNAQAISIYCSLLLLATFGLVIPTTFNAVRANPSSSEVLSMSREIALLMVLCYCGFLWFQLKTHKYLFDGDDAPSDDLPPVAMEAGAPEDDEEEEEPQFSLAVSVGGLAVVTVLIAFQSEFLVSALEPTSYAIGLSSGFISVILLPIVGNAAEHATAVVMAYNKKMDIAIGVAVGSSIQIALLVVPLLVLISWMFGLSLDLDFHPFAAIVLIVSVVIANSIVSDGSTHWLEGVLLLVVYLMVAVAFIYIKDPLSANVN